MSACARCLFLQASATYVSGQWAACYFICVWVLILKRRQGQTRSSTQTMVEGNLGRRQYVRPETLCRRFLACFVCVIGYIQHVCVAEMADVPTPPLLSTGWYA